MTRAADTCRFYDILAELEQRLGGKRTLATCSKASGWPQRGVYFFFEPGELRSVSGDGPRVVRIGTHGLKDGANSTLWGRLSQHRGSAKSRGGNHRGSIFRLLVGVAICQKDRRPPPASWGVGAHPGVAAVELGISRAAVLAAEHSLEVDVSAVIGAMPFLWLDVDDPACPASDRGVIECNSIGLVSAIGNSVADPMSSDWLGRFSDRAAVRDSGLWNVRCVSDGYRTEGLDVLARWVSRVQQPAP